MKGRLCQLCGEDHDALDALWCTERCADRCRCGICLDCTVAGWWRQHPGYRRPPAKLRLRWAGSPPVPPGGPCLEMAR